MTQGVVSQNWDPRIRFFNFFLTSDRQSVMSVWVKNNDKHLGVKTKREVEGEEAPKINRVRSIVRIEIVRNIVLLNLRPFWLKSPTGQL